MKTMKNTENQEVRNFELLSELTAQFKKTYLNHVEMWLQSEFEAQIEFMIDFTTRKWSINERSAEYFQMQKKAWNMDTAISTCAGMIQTSKRQDLPLNFEKFNGLKSIWFAKQLKKSDKSFDASLMKIAFNIQKVEMNIEKAEVVNAFMNNGIDLTLTDGDKKVHAFTIIAFGEIQRPHFRFLIKTKKGA
jgi:hypothetical protein